MIRSIYDDQQKIIESIITLYCPKGIQLDPTYSKGVFYKNIKEPLIKMDIRPQVPGTIKADARHLPLKSESIDSIMFDPPFLATTGPSLGKQDASNKINKRFGVFPNELELHKFYSECIKEFHRVLFQNGHLIFKCQDKVSSGKQYMSHVFIINEAVAAGFYPIDLFILEAKNRIVADWQKNQRHARKYHSYFIIFQKCDKVITYKE